MTKCIQDSFWTDEYAESRSLKNSAFANELGRQGWGKILDKSSLAQKIYLDIGCNVGHNLD